jgi:HK97 family phage major capsid protein
MTPDKKARLKYLALDRSINSLSPGERAEMLDLMAVQEREGAKAASQRAGQSYAAKNGLEYREGEVPDTRGVISRPNASPLTGRTYQPVRGIPCERLTRDQSFAEYVQATSHRQAPEIDWDAYWTAKCYGFENAETRALTGFGEDITSGPGAGSNIVGQVWSSQVVDLIRAHTFTDALGATTIPLTSEITNMPLWNADVQPMWVGEGTAVSGDITPSTGVLQYNCQGAVMDYVPVSRNLIDDAVSTGGVSRLIQHSIAEKFARVIDTAALYGIQGSPGNPGLCGESGLLTETSTNASSYKDLSTAAALVRGQNVEPNGFLWHPSTMSKYAQLVDTLGQPMRMTPDIENLDFANSGLLNYQTESSTGAFNSGSDSSIFVGDWSWMTIGMRTNGVETMVLRERAAEYNQIVFLTRARFSIRSLRVNQTFCRLTGVTY